MNLTFAEDFTSSVDLDSELIGTPDSGLYWNRGVHPILTVNNLFAFLPDTELTFTTWNISSTYGLFNNTRKKSDIVSYDGNVYQSLTTANVGNQPDTSTANWLLTDLNSLKIKSFIWTVEDNALSALSLNRMLIENQYIYNLSIDKTLKVINNDYIGWVFQPKGSDYVTIRINQISLQANTTTAQSLYVINQGTLIDTLTLNPNNGVLEFEDLDYSFSGKGEFLFIIDGQDVYTEGVYNDPLRYKGFVCYPVVGTGDTPEGSDYSASSISNGLNFNVSCYLDSSKYIENNKIDLAKFYQTQFEYDFVRMVLHNSNTKSNSDQRNLSDGINRQLLAAETMNIDMATVAKKYKDQKAIATEVINRTFDKFLQKKKGLRVKRRVL